jgi:hypothetical protein
MDEHKNKFWVALGRCSAFSEDNNRIFRVWTESNTGKKNQSWDLMPKFIDAKDAEDARQKLHWFIDKMFGDFYASADKEAGTYVPVVPVYTKPGPTPDSLSIDPEPTQNKGNDGLLDLGKL